jgi:two-component system LytT family sensor kinase
MHAKCSSIRRPVCRTANAERTFHPGEETAGHSGSSDRHRSSPGRSEIAIVNTSRPGVARGYGRPEPNDAMAMTAGTARADGWSADRGERTLMRWTAAFWVAFTLLDIVKDHLFKDVAGGLTWEASYIITTDSIIFWGSWGLLAPVVYMLVERYPISRLRAIPFMATHLAGALAVGFFHLFVSATFFHLRSTGRFTFSHIIADADSLAGGFLLHDVVVYWGLAAVCIAWTRGAELRRRRIEAAEMESHVARLEAATTRARLAALRRQLDPHFLFNALNAASGLARKGETRRVTAMLARLGDLLRGGLAEDASHELPLEKELRWLDLYFAIERERFQERLDLRTAVPKELHGGFVPALVLQPLVENAVRHGIGPDGVGRVTVSGRREGDRLVLVVEDSGRGVPPTIGNGVGLANTRERLHELYGEDALLRVLPGEHGGTRATLDLPWHTEALIATETGHD